MLLNEEEEEEEGEEKGNKQKDVNLDPDTCCVSPPT